MRFCTLLLASFYVVMNKYLHAIDCDQSIHAGPSIPSVTTWMHPPVLPRVYSSILRSGARNPGGRTCSGSEKRKSPLGSKAPVPGGGSSPKAEAFL